MQMHKEDLTIFKICNIVQSGEIHFLLLLLTEKIEIMHISPLWGELIYCKRTFSDIFQPLLGRLVGGSAGERANELLLMVSIKRRLHLKIQCSALSPGPAGWSKWPFYGENTRTGLQPVNQVERELLRRQLWGLFLPLPDLLPQRLPFNFTQTTSDFWNCSALIFATQFRPEQRSVSTWAGLQEMWRFSFWSNGQLKRVEIADAYELKKVVQEWKKKTLK